MSDDIPSLPVKTLVLKRGAARLPLNILKFAAGRRIAFNTELVIAKREPPQPKQRFETPENPESKANIDLNAYLNSADPLNMDENGEDECPDKALIAPFGGGLKTKPFQKKIREINVMEELKKAESMPWILGSVDDFIECEIESELPLFVGTLEHQTADYMIFAQNSAKNGFDVYPVSQRFRFAEHPRFLMSTDDVDKFESELVKKRARKRVYSRMNGAAAAASLKLKKKSDKENSDSDEKMQKPDRGTLDELDFDIAEDFQDDEEDHVYGDLTEEQEGRKKVIRTQYEAGVNGVLSSSDDDEQLSNHGKSLQRVLAEQDREIYDDDKPIDRLALVVAKAADLKNYDVKKTLDEEKPAKRLKTDAVDSESFIPLSSVIEYIRNNNVSLDLFKQFIGEKGCKISQSTKKQLQGRLTKKPDGYLTIRDD